MPSKKSKKKTNGGIVPGRYDLDSHYNGELEKLAEADNRWKKPFVEEVLMRFADGTVGDYYNEVKLKKESKGL